MSKLDFLSFGAAKRKAGDPFGGAQAASDWYAEWAPQQGGTLVEALCARVALFCAESANARLGLAELESLLALNSLSWSQLQAVRGQYLLNNRMPRVLEEQLRVQILRYAEVFSTAYQRFFSADALADASIRPLLPLAVARVLAFRADHALWLYFRHFSPDPVFWLNVNQLYAWAERAGLESLPLVLYDDRAGTTIQDEYIALLMTALLDAGNLSARQVYAAHQLALRLANRTHLASDPADASFMVDLARGAPPVRPRAGGAEGQQRYWRTADICEPMNAWRIVYDSGRMPDELRRLNIDGLDGGLLHRLVHEWADRPTPYQRADRQLVNGRSLEVAHRLAVLHKLIRQPDEVRAKQDDASFDDAGALRIYGFVTSRSRLRQAPASPATEATAALADTLPTWHVEDQSTSGLGLSLASTGSEWVNLGSLIGYREADSWGLGIVRRIKRPAPEKLFVGLEIVSERPVAASLRAEDGRPVVAETQLPADRVWQGGEIALFVGCVREGRKVNALILASASYALGKQQYMSARGKHFLIALGRVLEKGADWCLCEIELIRPVEALPKP
ncbi:hypothetical protein [Crenobacter caeni]|uniref:PilZ domain-containing protein n=1 Tax=Crenobacter caeni TaxID=2705474 RepID=A0A6B2KNY7_9NEIS|nr:hypothetical protein [Crenobacter caeni]NDV11905.1 hypothetical protein [Crenobacter caeni]